MIRSEKTRQFIIQKTAPIFNKKGYTGTYLSDLTAATGLTKGSIYGNFKDKNEVAVEAFRYNYSFQTKEVVKKIAKANNATDQILVFLNHFKLAYEGIFKNGGCAILNTATDADDSNDLLNKEVVKTIQNWHDRIVTILAEGVLKNEIKNIEIEIYAYRMIALIEGSILLSKTLGNPEILLNNILFMEDEINALRLV